MHYMASLVSNSNIHVLNILHLLAKRDVVCNIGYPWMFSVTQDILLHFLHEHPTLSQEPSTYHLGHIAYIYMPMDIVGRQINSTPSI